MDPVTQTLAQQSSGSAEGQGFGQFYLQGKQLGQEDKRINLSQQRLQLEQQQEQRAQRHDNLIDPLHAKLMDAQAKNLGIEAVSNQQQVDLNAMKMAFTPELQSLEMDFLSSPLGGGDPELRSRARQLFDQNPAAKYSQSGQSVMQIIKGAVANAGEFRQVDEAYQRFGDKLHSVNPKTGAIQFNDSSMGSMSPEAKTVTDPVTGKPITMVRTGPNSWSKVAENALDRQQQIITERQQDKLVDWVREKGPQYMHLLQRDPATGRLTVPDDVRDQVAKVAGLTTATKAGLEQTEIGSENLVDIGRKLLPLINDDTVGVKGELTRAANRFGLTMIMPSLDNPDVAEADSMGRQFTSRVIRTLRSDSNINEREVRSLETAADAIHWTTPRDAKRRVSVFLRDAADVARRAAAKQGKPAAPVFQSYDDIRKEVVAGRLTPAEGAERYTNTADSLADLARKQSEQ